MHSYRVLGIIALGAIAMAVICFTVVDITIDSANGCLRAQTLCREHAAPPGAISYAVLGGVALLASLPFAAGWIFGMLRRPEPDAAPPHRRRRPLLIEEDL